MIARHIIDQVSKQTGVPVAEIMGRRRFRTVSRARFAVYHALRQQGWSYNRIGKLMQRDHSTVMAGVRKAATSP